jgi:hypothetical protein
MTNNDEFEYDVALSFAGEDRATVEKFARLLKAKNIKVFYDEYEAADMWGKDLIDHLVNIYSRKARYCVMFISQYYPLKKWTKVERRAAQERAFRDANEYILPLRLDDTQVPGITETTGYRDLRQHPMEDVVNLLEQKVIKSKKQSGLTPESHDLRSGNVPSTNTQFGDIPLPKRKKNFTQFEKDQFAEEAFDYIKQYFEYALQQLSSQDSDIKFNFTPVTKFEFTGKIYLQGNVKARCRIWLGDSNTIYYNEQLREFGQGNSYNDYLTVEDNGEELLLRISGMSMTVHVDERLVAKEKAAEHLWKRFTVPLSYR